MNTVTFSSDTLITFPKLKDKDSHWMLSAIGQLTSTDTTESYKRLCCISFKELVYEWDERKFEGKMTSFMKSPTIKVTMIGWGEKKNAKSNKVR